MPGKKPKPKGHTVIELAQTFEESEQTVRSFVAQLKPIGVNGRSKTYDYKDVKRVLDSRQKRSKKPDGVKGSEQRKLDLQCRKLELDIEEREGKLIPQDEVRRFIATHTSAVTTHIRRQPGELASLLEGLSVARIEKKLTTSGEELIAKLRAMPVDD